MKGAATVSGGGALYNRTTVERRVSVRKKEPLVRVHVPLEIQGFERGRVLTFQRPVEIE